MEEGPAARPSRRPAAVARVLLASLVAAPGLAVVLSASSASAALGDGGDGYAAPTVVTVAVPSPPGPARRAVVVPSPTPSPAPTATAAAVAPNVVVPPAQAAAAPPQDAPTPITAPSQRPTILRNVLPTIRDVLSDPRRIAVGAATAALWFLLVALPGSLLDSAIERRSHGRMGRALAAVSLALTGAIERVSRRTRWKLAGPLLIALLAGAAFGFADPHLAWDGRSLSTMASLFVALTLITVVASQVGALLARTWWGIDAEVRAEPLGLLAALAGVAVGRFLSLSPGLFLGLVVGVDAGERADRVHRSKAVVARHAVVFTFAIAAWVAYSSFFAHRPEEGIAGFTSDVLSATTIEGLTYLVTSLLPLPLLAGREVFLHSKRLWAGLYGPFALVFAVLALPSILGEQERSPSTVARQGAVMLAFTAVSIVGWLRSRNRTPAPDELQRV
ncbi:MAG: hypothetical protein BGO37_02400 [Cellulomonas sp. 73-92]|uniref:hypothetical protein n=1 Tax=Cellulomonas sp. 73-92 TaxID=1895740 RepID=UPI000929E370|nr:hypothetical protein [Cellulomonas sp. 73-92]OJV80250.1 MAG: hypothetical protein BGO37_02400 [Cellulomonas sp. 73-92]